MAYTGQSQSTPYRISPPMDDPAGDLKSLLVRVAEHGDKVAFATLFQHFA
ncbi:MAG: sigma-70 family RNA polymerase sigma factor, partial [Aeromonas sp.]